MENPGLFEKYLDGSLNEKEYSDFLKRLNTDAEFKEQFSVYEAMHIMIAQHGKRQAFKSVMQSVAKDYFSENEIIEKPVTHNKKGIPLIFKIAASIALLFALSLSAYMLSTINPSGRDLYAEYYSPLKVDFITRSGSDSIFGINKAFASYQLGDSKACLKTLSELEIHDSLLVQIAFLRGLAYLEIQDFTNAELSLTLASSDTSNIIYNDALWYLSLAYLSNNDTANASYYLYELIASQSSYSLKASEILEKIED
ncbi:MAG: hypothetical protein CVU05_03520 [Bacteroidetes bacterium HGW-Bacteroidetes-21]|jgi:hypothetical protein|nr:MAG: hypothetical protein CVU05_03520 [Bacteroidetes bacterium HGW-Bacteroidetes-21]